MKRSLALLFVLLAMSAPQSRGYTPADTSCFLHHYDGLGSTRFLTTTNAAVANVFAYDAYGTLIASNGVPQTVYLYCGEQFDPQLGFYYLRARYLNTGTGRFWTRDTWEGNPQDPLSLHRYLYCHADPVNRVDPSGQFSLMELQVVSTKIAVLAAKVIPPVVQGYNRATAAYDAIQDVTLVAGILGDGDVDEEESEILFELLDDYVKARVQAAAFRVATGVGGKALGAATGAAGRMRITQAGIQRTREWYRNHKARYPDGAVTTPNGKYTVQIRHGFPDFSPYAKKTVTIRLSGSMKTDFELADVKAGITREWREAQGLVWHHHQKLGRMELIPKDLNNPAYGGQWHAGGVKMYELLYGTTYGR